MKEKEPFVIQSREEIILDPNLTNIEKIGKFARLCYRVEPKEGENQHDVDLRIIKRCIESGHESVLEHGVISIFINPNAGEDSKRYGKKYMKSEQPLNFHQLFAMGATDAQMKYLESFMDPELYDKFCIKNRVADTEKRILPCFVGDVRSWRQVIRERVYLESQSGNVLALALTLKILRELYNADDDHALFADLVRDMNDGFFKDEHFMERFWDKELMGELEKDEVLNLDTYCKHAFKELNTVIAGQASSCASISMILTTDRATTHQHVRHRKNVAYSQESQRYVNYDKKGCRVMVPTVDPKKNTKNLTINDAGELQPGQPAYDAWVESVQTSFTKYAELLEAGMPPESARGVLPNDTATRIGVTWLRTSGFINFVYWRIDEHAQYSIRLTLARIIKKAFMMGHPYCETIPHKLAMSWLKSIRDQKLFNDNSDLDKLIEYREQVNENVQKYIKEHAAELEAQRK